MLGSNMDGLRSFTILVLCLIGKIMQKKSLVKQKGKEKPHPWGSAYKLSKIEGALVGAYYHNCL